MKKLFLAALLLLSIKSNCSVSKYIDKARLKLGGIADLALGRGSISPEDEQLIKELQAKAGIKGEIPVRNMNVLAKIILGFENAFVLYPGIFSRFYLNKDWLSELTKEEKEFLFAHELMHIKHKEVAHRRTQWLKDHAIKRATDAFDNTVSRSRERYADSDAVKLT